MPSGVRHNEVFRVKEFIQAHVRAVAAWPGAASVDGTSSLICYSDMPIRRHVKVKGEARPFDGDSVYWGAQLGRDPTKPKRVIRLLKQQHGCCPHSGLRFTTADVLDAEGASQGRSSR